MDHIAESLRLIRPEELYPLWSCVDLMDQLGEMSPEEAILWKQGIFGLMVLWELEPEDLDTAVW